MVQDCDQRSVSVELICLLVQCSVAAFQRPECNSGFVLLHHHVPPLCASSSPLPVVSAQGAACSRTPVLAGVQGSVWDLFPGSI